MNIRLTKNIPQMIGGIIILTILMCVGIFLYARSDLKRFKQSFGEPPKVSSVIVSEKKEMTDTHIAERRRAETTPESLTHYHIADSEPEELEMETPSLQPLNALMNELSLSEMEYPEEAGLQRESLEKKQIPWTDEFQAEIDDGRGLTDLISALESRNDIVEGNSQDVAIVIETLKRASKGPLAVDDLITMMEAWLRIQPNNPQEEMKINETRDFLTNMLSRLRIDREEFLQSGKETKYSLRIYYGRF